MSQKSGITITIEQGKSHTGQTEFHFSNRKKYITIGCDKQICDLVIDETHLEHGIGDEHLGLKRSLGRYELDLNTAYSVLVNGQEPFEGQEVVSETMIMLGSSVLLKIQIYDSRPHASSNKQFDNQPGHIALINRYLLRAILPTVFFLSLVAYFLYNSLYTVENEVIESQKQIAGISEKHLGLTDEINTIIKSSQQISNDIIKKISNSVYLVILQNDDGGERPYGTAWVYGNEIITNAHVADSFNELKHGQKLIVRSSTPPYRSHTVLESHPHPGYELYTDLWKQYLPIQKGIDTLDIMRTASPADIARLVVTDSELLAPSLEIATKTELNNIEPGQAVAFVGYPVEKLLPGKLNQPVPVSQQDEVVRITDFFMASREDGNNRLIQHGIPLIGGASGSPLFSKSGKIIGIISSINIASTIFGRIANPADINFAQRIDFLNDLYNIDQDAISKKYLTQWTNSLKTLEKGLDTSMDYLVSQISDDLNITSAPQKTEITGSLKDVHKDLKRVGFKNEIYLNKPGLHLITLTSNELINFKLDIKDPKDHVKDYSYLLPYSNLIRYKIVVIDEPTILTIEGRTKNRKDLDEPVDYSLSVISWEHSNTKNLRKELILSKADRYLASNSKAEKIVFHENIYLGTQVPGKEPLYMTKLPVIFEKTGYYLMLAQVNKPQLKVDAAIVDDEENVLGKNNGNGFETILFHHHKNNYSESANYVLASSKLIADTVNVTIYYWPENESN